MQWTDADKELPQNRCKKYLAKKENGETVKAFFMPDKMAWIAFYGQRTSYWMDVDSGQLVHDVRYWMEAPNKVKQHSSEECPPSSCS